VWSSCRDSGEMKESGTFGRSACLAEVPGLSRADCSAGCLGQPATSAATKSVAWRSEMSHRSQDKLVVDGRRGPKLSASASRRGFAPAQSRTSPFNAQPNRSDFVPSPNQDSSSRQNISQPDTRSPRKPAVRPPSCAPFAPNTISASHSPLLVLIPGHKTTSMEHTTYCFRPLLRALV
jgi:hypothetical protein